MQYASQSLPCLINTILIVELTLSYQSTISLLRFLLEMLNFITELFLYLNPVPDLEMLIHYPSWYLVYSQPHTTWFFYYSFLVSYFQSHNCRETSYSYLMCCRHYLSLYYSFRFDTCSFFDSLALLSNSGRLVKVSFSGVEIYPFWRCDNAYIDRSSTGLGSKWI